MTWLIIARAVQGIGGGGESPSLSTSHRYSCSIRRNTSNDKYCCRRLGAIEQVSRNSSLLY